MTILKHNGNLLKFNNRIVNYIIEKTGYGALYNWYTVDDSASHDGFIENMNVASDSDWIELRTFIGVSNLQFAARIKSSRNEPLPHPRFNAGAFSVNDTYNFNALPGASRFVNGTFSTLGHDVSFWTSTEFSATQAFGLITDSIRNDVTFAGGFNKRTGYSVRCVRSTTIEEDSLTNGETIGVARDFNGNYYELLKIGNQVWTAQNIRSTHFVDGTPIPNVTDNTEWGGLETPAYCWYDNNPNTPGIVYTDELIEF